MEFWGTLPHYNSIRPVAIIIYNSKSLSHIASSLKRGHDEVMLRHYRTLLDEIVRGVVPHNNPISKI